MQEAVERGGMPAKEIVIVSTHRSGTNFFCECLNVFPEVMGLYEVFNSAGAFGVTRDDQLPVLNSLAGMNVRSDQDQELVQLFREDPKRALGLMNQVAVGTGRSALSYKIFQQQLSGKIVKEIISDENREVLFLTRSRLDTFISYQKARRAGAWTNKDTSRLKPRISIRAFLERSAIIDAWHEEVADILDVAGKSYRVLSYDRHVDMPKADLIDALAGTLQSMGINVSVPEHKPATRHKRQDVKTDPFGKVANGATVRAKLEERGLMEFAMGEPLGRRNVPRGHAPSSGGTV